MFKISDEYSKIDLRSFGGHSDEVSSAFIGHIRAEAQG